MTEFVVQWYYVFLIINVFLVSLVSGSLISSIKVCSDQASDCIDCAAGTHVDATGSA